MKKLALLSLIILIAAAQISSIALHSNGIAGYNNSPGEITCNNCHATYPLNDSGNAAISMATYAGSNYLPGQTYTVNVKITKTGLHLFGFSLEALDTAGANAGTLSLINSATTILINAPVNGNNRTNVTHYGGVYGTDTCTFSFRWTAPAVAAGKITFYAAANASNGDGYTYGDYIYTTSRTLSPSQTTAIANTDLSHAVSIFPNPAGSQFFIETALHDTLQVSLYDAGGKQVLNATIKERSAINTQNLNAGIYTITIKARAFRASKKLIIVR